MTDHWISHEKRESWKSWIENVQSFDPNSTFMMHYWTELEEEANKDSFKDDQAHQDLRELLSYMKSLEPEQVTYRLKLETLEIITRRFSGLLFRPRSLFVTKPDSEKRHYQVLQVRSQNYLDRDGIWVMIVVAWAFDWNETELIRQYFDFALGSHHPSDEIRIRDLPCWPIRYLYHDNIGGRDEEAEEVMRVALEARGRKLPEHCVRNSGKNKMCNFEGTVQVWEQKEEFEDRLRFKNRGFQGETKRMSRKVTNKPIMVDVEAYRECSSGVQEMGPLMSTSTSPCRCLHCVSAERKEWIQAFKDPQKQNGELPGKEKIENWLLPYRLLGYAIDDNFWAQFPVEGSSGLGKTSTADSLARVAERPLIKVSASGIGSTSKVAEANLKKYFRLATSWEAIILLDEADVFLETRGTPGEKVFERNALVAVMLRTVEYFSGVLFLTTNRVMKLDIAMLSRIHYAIHFTELTKDQERGIWDAQIEQLSVEKHNVTSKGKSEIRGGIKDYLKRSRKGGSLNKRMSLNGREIHNIFKTAQHLANGDGGRKIEANDLEAAVEAIQSFRGELQERVEKAERHLVAVNTEHDA